MQTIVTKTHLLTFALLVSSAFNVFAQLGSSSSDLVFNPITPCRIVDTRNAGGVITSSTYRSFKSWGASFTSQGGSPTDCGIPQSTNVAAIAVNLLVVSPVGGGWIAAWPNGLPRPLVSNLNFTIGAVLANSAILKVDQTSANGYWNLYTTTTTDFVADVTGYYTKPVSVGSLECETLRGAVSVLANSSDIAEKLCTADFVMTGGGCDHDAFGTTLMISKSSPSFYNNGWFCRWQNTSAGDVTAFVYARCCRIPGR
jgi:hypothetical protein